MAALALALGALPMGATSPAQAAPAKSKCTVVAKKPTAAPQKTVRYRVQVRCPLGYQVEVDQRMYEADKGADESIGKPYAFWNHFDDEDDLLWEQTTRAKAPNTEPGAEEVYQVVRYREYGPSATPSKWYSKTSPVASIK